MSDHHDWEVVFVSSGLAGFLRERELGGWDVFSIQWAQSPPNRPVEDAPAAGWVVVLRRPAGKAA